ncbi:MAG TPA: hypothetical protein VIX86_04630 [Streptosporangiaceae bacterium]
MAEFIISVVLIGMSPVLTPAGKTDAQGNPVNLGGASLAKPLVRLTAVSALFLVLALLSTGAKTGKVAAWFGGLVVLGVGFNAAGELEAISGYFGGGTKAAGKKAATGTTQAPGTSTAGGRG